MEGYCQRQHLSGWTRIVDAKYASDADPQANALKAEANKAFSAKDYSTATRLYSEAIALDSSNHVLFSNRSASKAGAKDYQGALEDAEKVSFDPSCRGFG